MKKMADALYFIEKKCAVCGESFEVTCVRSRLSLIKQDTDFCAYYKDVNPYYYTIWTCSHCGYAARDIDFEKISESMAVKVREFLSAREVKVSFAGIRTWEQAVVTYKLAIFYSELTAAAASKMASLYIRLAWLYRENGQIDEEKKMLTKACESFDQALEREPMPLGNMSELTVMYLIADLLWRTGKNEKAKLYLSKIVSNPLAKQEKRIADLARDLWQEMRFIERNSSLS